MTLSLRLPGRDRPNLGTATAEHTSRDVAQSGVRLRMYTDLRQVLDEATPPKRAPAME
ncbi:DUF6207 family protein [Streptomyces sp. NPDC004232]|uniref:DUF6207 family protein n=1 Tax=Streptomyces sp. NPDC004232 TaxID=3154454 RepID=UPI0033B741B9